LALTVQNRVTISHRSAEFYRMNNRLRGQYFGEMALLSEPHFPQATVTTVTKTHIIRILQADFLEFLAAHPNLPEQIEQEIEKRQ
jgi:CRP-like cAMP-binding protein